MLSEKDKLISLIEYLSLHNIDDGTITEKTGALELIYKCSHILQGGCEVHKDWEKELLDLWTDLDEKNLI